MSTEFVPHRDVQQSGIAGLKHLRHDIVSGMVASLVSLPISSGIAIASGVPPIYGLISAIIAGLVFPLIGGAYVTIAGPAAGLAPALIAIMVAFGGSGDAENVGAGYPFLLVVIFIVGTLQIAMSLLKLARFSAIIPVTNIYNFNKDGQVGAADVTDSQTHGTTVKTGLNLVQLGTSGPFAPEVVSNAAPATSSDSGVASALASTSASPLPIANPLWIVNRLAHVDLNHGPVAKYLEHLAHEGTAKAKMLLVKADEVADALNLDDELLDTLVAGLSS
jgi:hypothetical protein